MTPSLQMLGTRGIFQHNDHKHTVKMTRVSNYDLAKYVCYFDSNRTSLEYLKAEGRAIKPLQLRAAEKINL